ncbi:MAG: tyrosine recombinase XerC [Ruminococcaceae bacterium]|nr:tyrosine recombinase XerC [Oscillospiraceae bacterium]
MVADGFHRKKDIVLPYFAEDFLVYMEDIRGKSQKTVDEYVYDLNLFFGFMIKRKGLSSIGDCDEQFMDSVTLTDLYAFINYLNRDRKNKATTRARKVACLRSFFKYLYKGAGIISQNPALDLESPKLPKRLPKYLELDESLDLLKAIDGPHKERDYCIITLFLNCGMRLAELVGINIPNIRNDSIVVTGKGNKERTVYLNDACLRAIDAYLAVRKTPDDDSPDKNALFLSNRGKRISPKTVEHLVKKFITKAGLDPEKYSAHKLRHTAATLMYTYGNVDIRSLQEILGHESVATTEIYTHVNKDILREAVNNNPLANIGADTSDSEDN